MCYYSQTKIETIVKEACDHLPDSVQGQCREFVETYGNAFIALLAQEIDPSQVTFNAISIKPYLEL